jgi:hypothetical protein
MLKKVLLISLGLMVLSLPAGAKSTIKVQNYFYNAPDCPITIAAMECVGKDTYVAYNIKYSYPGGSPAKNIVAIRFEIVCIDAFEKLHDVRVQYTDEELIKPGKGYKVEGSWYDKNANAVSRAVIFPMEVKFEDGSSWASNTDTVRQWLVTQYEAAKDLDFDVIFENHHIYNNPSDCPIQIVGLTGGGHGYYPSYSYVGYSYWTGNYIVNIPETPAGFTSKIIWMYPVAGHTRKIVAVKFKFFYFDGNNQLIDSMDGYSSTGPFKPGFTYRSDWSFPNMAGPSWGRSVAVPIDIKFDDGSKWEINTGTFCDWLSQQFTGAADVDCANLFLPEDQRVSKVKNVFYTDPACPVNITNLTSEWKSSESGIWCHVEFECPGAQDKTIVALKFGLICVNAFDELLFAGEGYTTSGPFKSGNVYTKEWLTTGELLGPTLYKTIVFPSKVRYDDGSWWEVDKQVLYDWFLKQMEFGGDIKMEQLFPEKMDESGKEESKTPV